MLVVHTKTKTFRVPRPMGVKTDVNGYVYVHQALEDDPAKNQLVLVVSPSDFQSCLYEELVFVDSAGAASGNAAGPAEGVGLVAGSEPVPAQEATDDKHQEQQT